jgi:hypothetical protein
MAETQNPHGAVERLSPEGKQGNDVCTGEGRGGVSVIVKGFT